MKKHRIVLDVSFTHDVTEKQAMFIVQSTMKAGKRSSNRSVSSVKPKSYSHIVGSTTKQVKQLERRIDRMQDFVANTLGGKKL